MEISSIKGEGIRRLMENSIKNFHFAFLYTSLKNGDFQQEICLQPKSLWNTFSNGKILIRDVLNEEFRCSFGQSKFSQTLMC